MNKKEIKAIYEEHFVSLSKAAKNQCSGEELKAITEALIMTEKRLNTIDGKYDIKGDKLK